MSERQQPLLPLELLLQLEPVPDPVRAEVLLLLGQLLKFRDQTSLQLLEMLQLKQAL